LQRFQDTVTDCLVENRILYLRYNVNVLVDVDFVEILEHVLVLRTSEWQGRILTICLAVLTQNRIVTDQTETNEQQ